MSPKTTKHPAGIANTESENCYFDSYGHFGIHEEMLKDSVRTKTYMNAILRNKRIFKNKVVLDVGCGTGILSMFAAKAGAKHVYAIEMAEIAEFARRIVKQNGFSDRITVIRGKMEEIELPVRQVDIIVSEWMGYFLLFESMLDSVLFARDKFLSKDGIILPDKATLFLCGIEDYEFKLDKIHYWDDVYGFDMSCLKNESLKEPLVDYVNCNNVITSSFPVFTIDLYKVSPGELTFSRGFTLKVKNSNYLHAFVAYFDVYFDHLDHKERLTTGPYGKNTHWKQTVFYTDTDVMLNEGDLIKGTIKVKRNPKNFRETDILIVSSCENKENKGSVKVSQKRWYYLR